MQLIGRGITTEEIEVQAARRLDVVDITAEVAAVVHRSAVREGIVVIFCRHTTCGVTINELESGLIEDLRRRMTALVPDGYFAHDDLTRRTQNLQGTDEPANGAAHMRQMLFGATSQTIPIVAGELALGRWQRALFVECDIPKPRALVVTVLGC